MYIYILIQSVLYILHRFEVKSPNEHGCSVYLLCFAKCFWLFMKLPRKLLTTNCCELGECMSSCFSSRSRFENEAEHCEHAYDPSTDILGLMELPLFSSLISSLMLLDECVDVGVCCDCCWCCWCCCCCCCCWCFIKKSTGTFSLSPDKPDTNDGTKCHKKEYKEKKNIFNIYKSFNHNDKLIYNLGFSTLIGNRRSFHTNTM